MIVRYRVSVLVRVCKLWVGIVLGRAKRPRSSGLVILKRLSLFLRTLTLFLKRLTFPSENLFFQRKVVSLHPVIASRVAQVPTNRPKQNRWQRW